MKKYLLTLALGLFASASAFAGIFSGDNDKVTCDLRLGCNFNTVYANLKNGKNGKIGSYKGGFSGGVNVRYYPIEAFAIETGLGVQQKGSKDMTIEGWNQGTQYNPWYIEMPLMASVRVINFSDEHMGFFEAGLFGACGIGGKWTTYWESGPMFGENGITKRGDFGFIVGGSAIIAENFYAGFRYQRSIMNIGYGVVADSGKFYNNGFSIRFGIML